MLASIASVARELGAIWRYRSLRRLWCSSGDGRVPDGQIFISQGVKAGANTVFDSLIGVI